MKLKRLEIKNIRSYKELDIHFNDGVTVVSGVNGSGKSSLLEACFTGMFGSRSLAKNLVISDIIRKGATKASIKVHFEHRGNEYLIEQEYKVSPNTGMASNSRSTLSMNGDILIDQTIQTYEAIKSLLKMDEEAYKNCVYIRQGEIDILINAKPAQRQRMIDDLLQIGKLEEYRERANSARLGVGRHQRDTKKRIDDKQKEIDRILSENPYQKLNRLGTQATNIQKNIEGLDDKKSTAARKMEEIKEQIKKYNDLEEQKKTIESRIQNFLQDQSRTDSEIENIKKQINSRKAQLKQSQSGILKIKEEIGLDDEPEPDIERYIEALEEKEVQERERLNDASKRIELEKKDERSCQDKIDELTEQLSGMERALEQENEKISLQNRELENLKNRIVQIENQIKEEYQKASTLGFTPEKIDNIEDIQDLLSSRHNELHGKEREKHTILNETKRRVQKSKELLQKGICPRCGQDLSTSCVVKETREDELNIDVLEKQLQQIHQQQTSVNEKIETVQKVTKIAKRIHDLTGEIELTSTKIESGTGMLDSTKTYIESGKADIQKLKEQIDDKKLLLQKISNKLPQLEKEKVAAASKHTKTANKINLTKKLREQMLQTERMETQIKGLKDTILNKQEKIGLIEDRIKENRQRSTQLDHEMGEYDATQLKKNYRLYKSAHENIVCELQNMNSEKENILKQTGQLENQIKLLSRLEEIHKELNNRLQFLNKAYEDAEELATMYTRLRAQLRSRNIEILEHLINEIFSFMYTNNAYSHIQLDQEYNLTIYEKDGTPLEPKLLSGGERAIFNLVLRCAIYQLLSRAPKEDIKDNNSLLPPLILDEPTVFLDRGHIQQLIKLIDMMKNMGVGQILIVSHDESLIDSADNVFSVEKDPVTNTSSITAR